MNVQTNFRVAGVLLAFLMMIASCKKNNDVTIPPPAAHFMNNTAAKYIISAPGVVYKIPVGVTNVSDKDRTVSFGVSSTTGAVEGTQFTFTNTITIPAGKAVDSLIVRGNYDQYLSGRIDTLIFYIQNGKDAIGSFFNDTFRLVLRGPCSEADVDLNTLLGDYNNTNEFLSAAYGPYTTSIIAVNPIDATSGEITVSNIFDFGWNPITFLLDWSDPNNRTVTLIQQSGIADASTLDPSLAGLDVSVRPYGGQVGTFSVCSEKLTLKMQVGVTGLGWVPDLYTVEMAR
ncbi:MAG: hypothetical protein ABJA57_10925 [Ginsengibacter sp.]